MAGVGGRRAQRLVRTTCRSGQRIVIDVLADLNVVAYAGTEVQPDPCLTSLPAYIYARDYTSAESLIFTGGVVQPYYFSRRRGRPRTGRARQRHARSRNSRSSFTKETNASIEPITVKPKAFGGGHRLTWRMLGE